MRGGASGPREGARSTGGDATGTRSRAGPPRGPGGAGPGERRAIDVVECDVPSFEDCARMAAEVRELGRTVEILVTAAGITRDKTWAKMEPDQWRAVLDTNLNGVYNVPRQFIDGMVERGF